jgi:hypothetical protein
MSDKVDKYVRETQRYLYEDGLVEIGVGLLFLAAGLGLLAFLAIQDKPLLAAAVFAGLLALATAAALLAKRAQDEVKGRVTYPRTGYVSYRSDEPVEVRWLVLTVATLFIFLAFVLPEELTRISSAIGALMFVIMSSLGYRLKINRFFVVGGVALAVGVSVSYFINDEALGVAITFMVVGLGLLISGAAALFSFLRSNPAGDEV